MKKSKLAPIAGPAAIILGIIGIAGLIFGLISYADTDNKTVSYIGIVLSEIAIAWTCIFYYLWDVIP